MDPFCPACQSVFLGTPRCPRCGNDLGPPPEGTADGPSRTTPAGRVTVGALAAAGLYLGLREVAAGWAGLSAAEPVWWLAPAVGGVAAAFGGLLAGVGQRSGLPVGAAVGGLCGLGFLFADGKPTGPVLFALPVGAAGAWVWAAPAAVALPVASPRPGGSSIRLLPAGPREDRGRSGAWGRVLLGAAVIAAGVSLADTARLKAQRYSGGLLRVDNGGQGRVVSLQLAALAALAGGTLAAAGTGAGLRQGGLAGAVAAAGVVGLALTRGEFPVPVAATLERAGVATGPQDPTALMAAAAGVVGAGLAGGWFGGVLFPPLAPRSMRERKVRVGGD